MLSPISKLPEHDKPDSP